MDSRRRLYKATGNALTMTERLKKDRTRQNDTRKDIFNANRNIQADLNDSVSTPTKPAAMKISQIKDKPARLKAYIEQKRTNQLKEKIEQRSPFIPYVPVGRWVEKKEPMRKPKAFTLTTPVRKALLSDGKILKKSTIKEIATIATTAKKENVPATIQKPKQVEPKKSRKKILVEINNVVKSEPSKVDEPMIEDESPAKLNETFELLSSEEDDIKPVSQETVQKSPSPLVEKPLKKKSPLAQKVPQKVKEVAASNQQIKDKNPVKQTKATQKKETAKVVMPVKRPTRAKTVESVQPKKEVAQRKKPAVKSSKTVDVVKTPLFVEPVEQVREATPQKSEPATYTYQFYKSALENQDKYISIQLKGFTNNMDTFINKLNEDMQSTIHQTIQQGKLLLTEKFKSFDEILEKHKNADKTDPKRITEDDVENYWMLLYDQVEKFKENLQLAQEAKTIAIKEKRRTRKTLNETPSRRSRRIAECVDSPKHHSPACFACTPMSASKTNTPRSAKKKRAPFKKSIAFDDN